jgi:sporulation protein YlmC with PRC-barrel domain
LLEQSCDERGRAPDRAGATLDSTRIAMEVHMKRMATLLGVSLMTALPLASAMAQQPSTPPAAAPQGQQAVLVGSDSLVGSTVRNNEGRDIGKVDRLMIDPSDGRISQIIIATGGTLGVGSNMISVPWSSVKVGHDRGKVIVTASQMLDHAPGRASAPADQPKHDQQKNDQQRKQ